MHPVSLQQWSFDELTPGLYTNAAAINGVEDIMFHFQVVYPGTISFWPTDFYTPPPNGVCLFYIEP